MKNFFKDLWDNPIFRGAVSAAVGGAIAALAKGQFDPTAIGAGVLTGLGGFLVPNHQAANIDKKDLPK